MKPIPFDSRAVRSYGLVVAAIVSKGRTPRSRFADLLIAATAHANGLDLYSRNAGDFVGLGKSGPGGRSVTCRRAHSTCGGVGHRAQSG